MRAEHSYESSASLRSSARSNEDDWSGRAIGHYVDISCEYSKRESGLVPSASRRPQCWQSQPGIVDEFEELAQRWAQETSMLSSTSQIVANFHYYRIIALGRDALPSIFRKLKLDGGQWFLALRAITNENPVKPEERGNIKKMKASWLNWAKEHGYI